MRIKAAHSEADRCAYLTCTCRKGRAPLVVAIKRTMTLTAILTLWPASAYAADPAVPESLVFGAGLVAMLMAIFLLLQLGGLRRLTRGSIIAENITYAVLAGLCLVTAVILGWAADFLAVGLSSEQARFGADLLVIAAMFLLSVYFVRVKRAMSRFLGRLTGEAQMLSTVLDPDLPEDPAGE